MTPEEFSQRFPTLFHMTDAENWPSIQRLGLLSTSAILDRWEVSHRNAIESSIRRELVTLTHPDHGTVVIRDQKPMSERGLRASLRDGIEVDEWLRLLNGLVFFWTSRKRLEVLLNAREYRDSAHTIIEVDTERLVQRHGDRVLVSTMNTGSTRRCNPRGRSTFRRLPDVPSRDARRVVELCVENAVPDVLECARSVRTVDASEDVHIWS